MMGKVAKNQETQTEPAGGRIKKPRKKEIAQEEKGGLSLEISLQCGACSEVGSRNSLKKRDVPEIDYGFLSLSYDDAVQESSRKKVKGVSTSVNLLDESWSCFLDVKQQQHNKPLCQSELIKVQKENKVAERIKSFRRYSREEVREEMVLRLSTKLNLYEDPFVIKKQLTGSDCNQLNRLMLSAETVRANILALMDSCLISQIEKDEGLRVKVWDYDTQTEHKLTLKRWPSSGCYLFGNNWKPQFVQRRNLKNKDVIGLFWDRANSRFGFRLISSAPSPAWPLPLVFLK